MAAMSVREAESSTVALQRRQWSRPMSRIRGNPVLYPDPVVPIVATLLPAREPSRYHRHTDADWECVYSYCDNTYLRVAGKTWRLRAGDVFVVRPDQGHVCESSRGRRANLIFRQQVLRALPFRVRAGKTIGLEVAGKRLPPHMTVGVRRRPTVERIWERLQQESFGRESTKQGMCATLLAELLLELVRCVDDGSESPSASVAPAARRTVEQICAEVERDLARPWSLGELARRSGYSITQLSLLFHAVVGASPCRWLAEQRVRRAELLLAQSEKATIDVALAVGFGSRSQFHRVFREVTGTTPSRYRAILRHEQQP
jgi:AraC-like DNA-binding protein